MSALSDVAEAPRKSSKRPLAVGAVLALLGAGGGYVAVSGGYFHVGGEDGHAPAASAPHGPAPEFVALDPVVVNLPRASGRQFLRFVAQIEAAPGAAAEVAALTPRIVDVLNGYLRAVEPTDFEDPAILQTLRAQLLRRVQVVVGEGRVRDLLVMEFVLN